MQIHRHGVHHKPIRKHTQKPAQDAAGSGALQPINQPPFVITQNPDGTIVCGNGGSNGTLQPANVPPIIIRQLPDGRIAL